MGETTLTWVCPECQAEVENPRRRGPHLSACRRSRNASYIYKPGDKHPQEWVICIECGERALVRAHGMTDSTEYAKKSHNFINIRHQQNPMGETHG